MVVGAQSEKLTTKLDGIVKSQEGESLGQAFNPKQNGLNFLRLLLASLVVISHGGPLAGHETPLRNLGSISVDAFFALSGFLILRSWLMNPNAYAFLWRRFLRLMPAYWVCIVATALIAAPAVYATENGSLSGFWGHTEGPLSYIGKNAFLLSKQTSISGTPLGNPYPGVWDLPLWTLFFEAICYLGIVVLGVVGILKRWPRAIPLFAVLAGVVLLVRAMSLTSFLFFDGYWLSQGARFGLMFLAGATLWLYRDKVPMRRGLFLASVGVVLGAYSWELITKRPWESYVALAALPLAYAALWLVVTVRVTIGQRNDLSYGVYIYGFVVTQLLAVFGLHRVVGWGLFTASALIATLPVAAASWFVVERKALSYKKRVPFGPRMEVGNRGVQHPAGP